jgi:hypothetical protein
MVSTKGFFVNSFAPFFPWDQRKPKPTQNQLHTTRNFNSGEGDPLRILKLRLAKGEITPEEYLELSKLLSY